MNKAATEGQFTLPQYVHYVNYSTGVIDIFKVMHASAVILIRSILM